MSRLSATMAGPAIGLRGRVDIRKTRVAGYDGVDDGDEVPVMVRRPAQNRAAGKRHPHYWPGERES